ncbi:MAG: acetylxylan esterase [Saprospiraceae bacterium]|nr:acetylxylan esterase [Saprospiraceae bacterium]
MKKILISLPFLFMLLPLYGQITISSNHENGIYAVGDTITWQIMIDSIDKYDSLRFAIKPGAYQVTEQGRLELNNNRAEVSYRFTEPGSVILEVRWGNPGTWFNRVVGGGVCAPAELELSENRPEDFHEFWNDKIKELAAVPMNPWLQYESLDDTSVIYAKVMMDNIRDSKIQAQLARPNSCSKYPALLIVQWAGVYGLSKDWVINRAKEGWLVLNINPHDLPIDREEDFYRSQSQNELKNYWAIGNDHRDSSYFLRMYLSCYRGVEYLKQHPAWNGRTLAVTGDSQGGQQTVMTAGLHPDVTAAMALVPAGFDMLGPRVGRKGGWPQWHHNTEGKDSLQVWEASRYYDVSNFVRDIKCPILVGVGLLDETCPPEGIIAGMNQLEEHKEIIFLPNSQHQDRNGSQALYRKIRDEVWLPRLKEGLNPLDN